MAFNIDIAIVALFLVFTLVSGLLYGHKVKNVSQYAIGDRKFNTATLAMTIAATWIGGGVLSQTLAETYRQGLYFILPAIGDSLVLILIGLFLVPRMQNFLGNLSIAEAMGNLYGRPVKIVTTIVTIISCIGVVAVQFKVSTVLAGLFFDTSSFLGSLMAIFIVTIYSTFGGIRSVTFTDVIQITTFCIVMPIISFIIWGNYENPFQVFNTIQDNALFNLNTIFDLKNKRFMDSVLLFLFFVIPSLESVIFQRISMASSTKQAKLAFIFAGLICLSVTLVISWIGILLLLDNPSLNPNNLLNHILDNYSYPGVRGMMIIGLIAVLMSTADSYINSASILISEGYYDFINAKNFKGQDLFFVRLSSVFVSVVASILVFNASSLLDLTLMIWGTYMPIITVPLMMAIFGYRTTYKPILSGMSAGVCTIIAFRAFKIQIDSTIPAMIANFVTVIVFQTLTKTPGEWKNNYDSVMVKTSFIEKIHRYWKTLSFKQFVKRNSPKNNSTYALFGIFSMLMIYATMLTIDHDVRERYAEIISIFSYSTLVISTTFITYPIWPELLKRSRIVLLIWLFSLFYLLVFTSSLQAMINNFGQTHLMIFLLNLIVLSILVSWQLALFFTLVGVTLSIVFLNISYSMFFDFGNIKFKIIYLLLLISSIVLAFIKPKQEYQEETEAKVEVLEGEVQDLDSTITALQDKEIQYQSEISSLNEAVDHYSERVADQAKEIERLGATAQKILNNVNHELRLPVGNVMNFAEMLYEGLGNYSQEQLKELTDEVYQNSTRLSTMILNMLDLATLDVKKVGLVKSTENFSELVRDRVKICRNIYLQGKPIDFKLIIEPEILISIDPNYMRQVVDNLVINAINFSEKGTIEIEVRRNDDAVVMTLRDQGKGIPREELFDIFKPFKMGSNSECQSQGRGVGLALCKSAVEAHGGSILAESPGGIGALFTIILVK